MRAVLPNCWTIFPSLAKVNTLLSGEDMAEDPDTLYEAVEDPHGHGKYLVDMWEKDTGEYLGRF